MIDFELAGNYSREFLIKTFIIMNYPEIIYTKEKALELDHFREMDYFAVSNYNLPIELMMENAGLQLASLAASMVGKTKTIQIGIGNGNNGGGGLVAARRLAAWGFSVHLSFSSKITKELPKRQLERAILFGASTESISGPDLWIDAWLGFSQRLPLDVHLSALIETANNSIAQRLSLDIPTGFLGDTNIAYFKADKVLTLAAPKRILFNLPVESELHVADLGIPESVYRKFKVKMLPFEKNGIVKLKRY